MPPNSDATIRDLQQRIAKLEQDAARKSQRQLEYPLDKNSIDTVSRASDAFLLDKVFNLLWQKTFRWTTRFESLDGFTVVNAGYSGSGDNSVVLTTTAAIPGTASVRKQCVYDDEFSFAYTSRLRTSFQVGQVTSQTGNILVGINGDNHYGFTITDGTLKGASGNTTTSTTVSLQSISANVTYDLEARYYPGRKVDFFVDGVRRASITDTTKLPETLAVGGGPITNFFPMIFSLDNGTAVARTLSFSNWDYFQALNITY